MRPVRSLFLPLLIALPSTLAIFPDEVGHIDYHHALVGLPLRETTFFHRPRRTDRASLLYTLSDVGVLAAVHPGSGEVVWRQDLLENLGSLGITSTDGGTISGKPNGFLRAGEGEGWVVSVYDGELGSWDAITGRSRFRVRVGGDKAVVRDLEVMELTGAEDGTRKDVLVLSEEEGGKETALRRLNAEDGSVVWAFRERTGDLPLQVSTNGEKVFVVSLKGAADAYNLKVIMLDTATGRKLDELVLGSKADVHRREDVMFVGANSAAPVVAWTDNARRTLIVNVLGTKSRQEFPLPEGTLSVEIHAPHLVQSLPHFLVHTRTATGHRGDVYHVDLKTKTISHAYSLPHLAGPGAFSTSSDGANVYFTRVTENEVILVSSKSHGILARWPLGTNGSKLIALHGVSEVVKRAGLEESYAVRAAVLTDMDDWVLIRNGNVAWSRPEGMTAGAAATFAEIPEGLDLVRSLEQEAHSNPLEAYIHRVKRHVNDLQYLPAYLSAIPSRVMSSILGTDVPAHAGRLTRDSFGFHKLVILASKRGMLYGLDIGNHGNIVWQKRPFKIANGAKWDVKGIRVDEQAGEVTVLGAQNDFVVFKTLTGEIIESKGPSGEATTQSAALVDTHSGQKLIRIGRGGKIGELPTYGAPKQTVVTRGEEGELKGIVFVPNGTTSYEATSWTFVPPPGQKIVDIATRPSHDAVASIGRVLSDRTVKYKYLNPNTIVVAAVNDAAHTLTIYLLDTISGQILHTAKYEGVDTSGTKPIECVIAENWFVCTFFAQYTIRETAPPSPPSSYSPGQQHAATHKSAQGYHLIVTDLYESDTPNSRGPLGNSPSFSSLSPLDSPTADGPVRPSVVSQSYIISAPLSALQVTQTRQGVTTRQVLAYLPQTHAIAGIPRIVLDPRRPVGRDPTPAEVEAEALIRYHPAIEIDPKTVITHQRDVIGVEKIVACPAIVESTSLVFAFGRVDVFGSRVAPSFVYDMLGKGFNKIGLVGTVVALGVGVVLLAPAVS